MILEFGEWLPDLRDMNNPGATVAKNCIPEATHYRSVKGLSGFTDGLNDVCVGAAWLSDTTAINSNFAGTASKLYQLSGASWSDVSNGTYTGDNWEFAKFGSRCIATNFTEAPQFVSVTSGGNFANLGGSPPKAKHIGVVKDFVVLGNIDDGTHRNNRVVWSGFNNSEIWTPSLATQSDYQDLPDSGAIQRIVGGEIGYIFFEHDIYVMSYAGPPTIFSFDKLDANKGRGTIAPNSVVSFGPQVFYYAFDGFYALEGGASRPIGNNKIDRWFRANADMTRVNEMRGIVDEENKLIMWSFRSPSATTINDLVLIYNFASDRWSYIEAEVEAFFEYVSAGLNLDTIDIILGDIDADSFDMDSDAYSGSALDVRVVAFDSTHKASIFNGDPLVAEIETKELFIPGSRTFINQIRPLCDGAVKVAMGTRNKISDSYSYAPLRTPNNSGVVSVRSNARYHRCKAEISGGFSEAMGIEVNEQQAGIR